MNKRGDILLYECDPEKNVTCHKKNCRYFMADKENGCIHTPNPVYARDGAPPPRTANEMVLEMGRGADAEYNAKKAAEKATMPETMGVTAQSAT